MLASSTKPGKPPLFNRYFLRGNTPETQSTVIEYISENNILSCGWVSLTPDCDFFSLFLNFKASRIYPSLSKHLAKITNIRCHQQPEPGLGAYTCSPSTQGMMDSMSQKSKMSTSSCKSMLLAIRGNIQNLQFLLSTCISKNSKLSVNTTDSS